MDNYSHYVEANTITVVLYPASTQEKKTYKIDSPWEAAKFVHFCTATTPMRAIKDANGDVFIEHLRLDGTMDMIQYQGRHCGGLNFITYGWEKEGQKFLVRIDVYTGEYKLVE